MTPSKGPQTAAELMAELNKDPGFRDRKRKREAQRRADDEASTKVQSDLIADLAAVGVEAQSAWDLVNTSVPYPDALPVLLNHLSLSRAYPDRVREGIARALAVRDARYAWHELRRLYDDEPEHTSAKDGLAVALSAAADDGVADELIVLARETRHGESRILLLRGLKRLRPPEARAALVELQDDPVLGRQARALLTGAAE